METETSFWDAVDALRARDARYAREAYLFVVEALTATAASLPASRRNDPVGRHLHGQELLRGVVRRAGLEFGPLAPTVFREWGVRACEDVGRIVFELIELGQMSAQPDDSIDDFRSQFDLLEALEKAGREAPARWRPPAEGRPERHA